MHEVFGCGIDIEELARFDRLVDNEGCPLIEDICTRREIDNTCGDWRVRFALSFACKEAFFKALGMSWTNSGVFWKDIELLFHDNDFGRHEVRLHNYAKEVLVKNNAAIGETFLDFNEEIALFQVVLVKTSEFK
jgi:phosphopantetheine--protein transferase-like protein